MRSAALATLYRYRIACVAGWHPVRVDMLLRTEGILLPGESGPGGTAAETLYSEELTGNR